MVDSTTEECSSSCSLSSDQVELMSVDMTWPREKITEGIMYQLKNLGFLSFTNIPGYDEQELLKNA